MPATLVHKVSTIQKETTYYLESQQEDFSWEKATAHRPSLENIQDIKRKLEDKRPGRNYRIVQVTTTIETEVL